MEYRNYKAYYNEVLSDTNKNKAGKGDEGYLPLSMQNTLDCPDGAAQGNVRQNPQQDSGTKASRVQMQVYF